MQGWLSGDEIEAFLATDALEQPGRQLSMQLGVRCGLRSHEVLDAAPKDVVDVDEEIARKADELLAADDREGEHAGVGATGGYIAAMADVLDAAVLTDNVDDFVALGGPVETY